MPRLVGDHLDGPHQFSSVIAIAWPPKGAHQVMRVRLHPDGSGSGDFAAFASKARLGHRPARTDDGERAETKDWAVPGFRAACLVPSPSTTSQGFPRRSNIPPGEANGFRATRSS